MQRAYVVHVVALIAGGVAFLSAIATGLVFFVGVAGLSFVVSGVSAYLGQRSALQPRGARQRIESEEDPEARRRLVRASGMLMGVLLVFFGLIAAVVAFVVTFS